MATKDCPANISIRNKTGADDVAVTAGKSYRLVGKNKEQVSHYLIEVPDASPRQRWVAVDCGSASAGPGAPPSDEGVRTGPASGARYVLALAWEAAFCESKPDNRECKTQTRDRFDATHFALHGLWPQPRKRAYCGVDKESIAADEHGQWEQLPEPDVSADIRARLDKAMPGTQSLLQRHEWIKHGTCYLARDAGRYFSDAIRLVSAVNVSPVQALFASRVGRKVTTGEIRAAFDQAFGEGAGKRVRIACSNDGSRRLISEITIGLAGDITPEADIGRLIHTAAPIDPGCPGGIVDPVGRQ